MVKCEYCNSVFKDLKGRAGHRRIHPEYLEDKKNEIISKKQLKDSYTFICSCGEKLENYKSLSAHRAKCRKYIELKRVHVDSIIDKAIELYTEKKYSINEIAEMFKDEHEYVTWSSLQKKFKELNIPLRTIQEAVTTERFKEKSAATIISNYGGTGNIFSSPIIQEKRDLTNLERYGAKNIYASQWFKDNITNNDEFWKEKHGMSRCELASLCGIKIWADYTEEERKSRGKNSWEKTKENYFEKTGGDYSLYLSTIRKAVWANYTEEERTIRVNSMLKARNFTNFCNKSKLEIDSLNEIHLKYPLDVQYCISNSKIVRIFDAIILDTKILIEINGDYWHANPQHYKSGDLIYLPGRKCIVDEVWLEDLEKKMLAEEHGYRVITIWESEIGSVGIMKIFEEKYENKIYS